MPWKESLGTYLLLSGHPLLARAFYLWCAWLPTGILFAAAPQQLLELQVFLPGSEANREVTLLALRKGGWGPRTFYSSEV